MAFDNRKAGFSLLELLVVMGIILSLTGMVISNYSSFSNTQKVKQAGRTLKNDFRFIQNRAASGVKPSGCATLVSYRFSFTATSYQYQPVCNTGPAPNTAVVINLPTDVTFSPVPAPFDFQVLTGASLLSSSTSQSFSLVTSSQTYLVAVSNNGDINDLGFQVDSPYPTP